MLAAVERVAELLTRIDRHTFDDDWVIQDAVILERGARDQ
jgi:uncharacterized protein with HEPN domain